MDSMEVSGGMVIESILVSSENLLIPFGMLIPNIFVDPLNGFGV